MSKDVKKRIDEALGIKTDIYRAGTTTSKKRIEIDYGLLLDCVSTAMKVHDKLHLNEKGERVSKKEGKSVLEWTNTENVPLAIRSNSYYRKLVKQKKLFKQLEELMEGK